LKLLQLTTKGNIGFCASGADGSTISYFQIPHRFSRRITPGKRTNNNFYL